MEYILTRTVEALILPPGCPMVLLALSVIPWFKKKAGLLVTLGLGMLYLSSIAVTTQWLWSCLDVPEPLDPERLEAQAIVVLGASRHADAPEYGTDTVTAAGLERIRYAAWLQKRTGLPILVSGGSPSGRLTPSEARIMHDILQQEFSAYVPWLEETSRNTYENAIRSSVILKKLGIRRIALVTQANHMQRAAEAFRSTGLEVTAAPTGYFIDDVQRPEHLLRWLPSARALYRNRLILHELLGRLWYRMWGRLSGNGGRNEGRTRPHYDRWSRTASQPLGMLTRLRYPRPMSSEPRYGILAAL